MGSWFRPKPPKPPVDPAILAARTATITAIYDEELGRPADAAGLADYLRMCATGATAEMIRADVRAGDEYDDHWTWMAGDLYRRILGRDPTDQEANVIVARFLDQPVDVLSPATLAIVTAELEAQRPTPTPMPITIRGTAFYESGRIRKWHGASDFRQFRLSLDGVDLSPRWAWARDLGVNTFRVFTRLSWAGLRETDYTDEQLRRYAVDVGARGFGLELVALADCAVKGWELDLAAQRRHVARLANVVGDLPHVLFELANEPTHATNQVDPLAFTKPAKGLWSRGSSHGDQPAIVPPWDYGTDHPPRDGEWPRKAKNLFEWADLTKVPYVGDEPYKIVSGLSREDCNDFAAVAELFAAGSTIHTQSLGIDGQIPTGDEQRCCEAWAMPWSTVPPEAQLGTYSRGGLASCPIAHDDRWSLRTFAMIYDVSATVVVVRPTSAWRLVLQPGWTVLAQQGHVIQLLRA